MNPVTTEDLKAHLASLDEEFKPVGLSKRRRDAHTVSTALLRVMARSQLTARLADIEAGHPDPLFVTLVTKPHA